MADAETKHIWCFHTCGGGGRSTFQECVQVFCPPEDQRRLPSSPSEADSSGLSNDVSPCKLLHVWTRHLQPRCMLARAGERTLIIDEQSKTTGPAMLAFSLAPATALSLNKGTASTSTHWWHAWYPWGRNEKLHQWLQPGLELAVNRCLTLDRSFFS